jgi:hypothetical protein
MKAVSLSPEVAQFLGSVDAKVNQQQPEPLYEDWRDPKSSYYSGITPDINLSGRTTGSNIPVYLPEGKVNIERDRFGLSGRVGLKGRTQAGSKFGVGAEGDWGRQWLGFPEELQAHGLPPQQRSGRGANLGVLDAFYETPGQTRFSVKYDHDPRRRGIYGGVTIPF